eukprot:GHVR01134397.1.p1 GENE.GHVR01134397.1~~GHVR01134397.1.p1  ORF type:complete len:193 (-),score=59.92 GHVR01134397.1:72-650(-)
MPRLYGDVRKKTFFGNAGKFNSGVDMDTSKLLRSDQVPPAGLKFDLIIEGVASDSIDDLDLAASIFDSSVELIDVVFWRNTNFNRSAIVFQSGVLKMNLMDIADAVSVIVISVSCYKNITFADIPRSELVLRSLRTNDDGEVSAIRVCSVPLCAHPATHESIMCMALLFDDSPPLRHTHTHTHTDGTKRGGR